jgi:hypothetical protein
MTQLADAIAAYVRAKDGAKPWLLSDVFAEDAVLQTVVATDTIAFPSVVRGRDAIADVLVRDFSRTYENIYTLCLCAPPNGLQRRVEFDWLVGMSHREDGMVRVGTGRYLWTLAQGDGTRVAGLRITIAQMAVHPPETLGPIMHWLASLPYPWCPRVTAFSRMPALECLRETAALLQPRSS